MGSRSNLGLLLGFQKQESNGDTLLLFPVDIFNKLHTIFKKTDVLLTGIPTGYEQTDIYMYVMAGNYPHLIVKTTMIDVSSQLI